MSLLSLYIHYVHWHYFTKGRVEVGGRGGVHVGSEGGSGANPANARVLGSRFPRCEILQCVVMVGGALEIEIN